MTPEQNPAKLTINVKESEFQSKQFTSYFTENNEPPHFTLALQNHTSSRYNTWNRNKQAMIQTPLSNYELFKLARKLPITSAIRSKLSSQLLLLIVCIETTQQNLLSKKFPSVCKSIHMYLKCMRYHAKS